MNLDERGRRAAGDVRREIGDPQRFATEHEDPFGRFERSLARRQRNQRAATILVAGGLVVLSFLWLSRGFAEPDARPAEPAFPSGSILVGDWDERIDQAHWRILRTDGTAPLDLAWAASCGQWFPDGTRILTSSDEDRGPGRPLRPVVIGTDGSVLEVLDATSDPDLELGCGDVSPDGGRIVLEGFNETAPGRHGIYVIRASDGGGLVRLTEGLDCCPRFSPDGSRVVFHRTEPGVRPDGAGAVFVVDADGSNLERITPWGSAFIGTTWSPDGEWIAFQRPYGRLFLVRPDGTDMHEVPVALPDGGGASEPAWTPDGEWIVFVLTLDDDVDLYAVRPDGTGLRRIAATEGIDDIAPDWRPTNP